MICVLLGLILSMGELTKDIYFKESDILFDRVRGYDVIRLEGCDFTNTPSEPQLPVKTVYFLLPNDSKVKEVKVKSADFKWLPGEYNILPAQLPQILSKRAPINFIEPKLSVYKSVDEYPDKLVEFKGEGSIRGYRIAELLVYPVQWIPKEKKLKLYRRIDISIKLDPISQPTVKNRPKEIETLIKSVVVNSDDLTNLTHTKLIDEFTQSIYEYLIITSDALKSAFEPLRDWKAEKGVPATIRTTEWISANYNGRDLAEKIRNFIITAQDSGLVWVLLGGDVDIVPARIAYAMTCGAGFMPNEDSLYADLYYSDLDGDWDANGNGVFGEVADNIDLYPDVFVGRAPVRNATQVQVFVNKVLNYERNPPADYLKNALFFAEILWHDPYTDGGIGKNMIGELFPSEFNIQKLYQSLGNENPNSVITAMNEGKNLLNHAGHGWIYLMGVGNGYLTDSDIDGLTNGNKQGILYSIGCWVGAFDYDCIAEHWVRNPNGGGVACIVNSRYGWGSPGNPGYGYSDIFDKGFYRNIFKENITHIGQILAKTKLDYIAFSREPDVYRWHQYQLNLLGEPELNIWTDSPCSLEVAHPESISIGESLFRIAVKNGSTPIRGALVCCMKPNEVYDRIYTNEIGEASFYINPSSIGSLKVTVTCHNYYPYQGIAQVFSAGPYPGYWAHRISDSGGNGEINPGDTITLQVTFKNFGTEQADAVTAILKTNDPYITISDSVANFGNIAPGDTAIDDFVFQVNPLCILTHIIQFTLDIINFGSHTLNLMIQTPVLTYKYYLVDTIPEPGDTFNLLISIKNSGTGEAINIDGILYSQNPYITILDSIANFGSLKPDSSGTALYTVRINQTCPSPYFTNFVLNLSTGPYSFTDTFLLKIGYSEFSDNVESGVGGWTHGGTDDLWHITERDCHSQTHSWWCGDDGSQGYHNNMNAWLLSPKFVVGHDSWLSFWYRFDVAIYGVDGIYVEVGDGNNWDTLDFIGSGGALDSIYMGNDWVIGAYPLNYPVGSELRVRFSFISDKEDVGEGFYIDDIQVGYPVQIANLRINDSLGNLDSELNPGEIVNFRVELINTGTSSISDAYALLTSYDPYITILDDSSYFGNIEPGNLANNFTNQYLLKCSQFATPGSKVRFALKIIGNYGSYVCIKNFTTKIGPKVGIEENVAYKFYLSQNKPNPFINKTIICYSLPRYEPQVRLTIYDLAGRVVQTLIDKPQDPGLYEVEWISVGVYSGVYFYKLTAGAKSAAKKLIIM
ncbi:MAG: C25 family cysteine peptidase [bacterium]|nr:C25 family cysteine peptidase [bacterium]